MKKILLSISLMTGAVALHAQSVETANQLHYYERYQSAENNFHTILKQQPTNAQAWYGLTRAYLLQKETDKAADSLHLAPSGIHSEPYYEVAYGSVLLNQNKKDSAAMYFNSALKETKEKDEDILSAVAEAHINSKNGDGNYAVEIANKAIKRDKKNPARYVLLGDAYRKLNNGSEAYKAYKQALEQDDKYAVALHKIGEIFLTQKNAELYLDYFSKAVAADANYAPSLYQLYLYYFYHDVTKAFQYYNQYVAKSDPSIQNDYDLADLLYLQKDYNKAIQKANSLAASEGTNLKPRIYKLLAYSYVELKDSAKAINYMQQYFDKGEDSNFIAKDFETMALLFSNVEGKQDSALVFYEKAASIQKDSSALFGYYKNLSNLAKAKKDYASQAKWLDKYYNGNDKATNVDLFNWGLANYLAEDFAMADSVFGMYVAKYPEQSFGYYWQARSNAALDKDMEQGTAIPFYKNLITALEKDTANTNYIKWMVEAYAYLAAYEANTEKDYTEAVGYFEKVLEVDPENSEAKKYIAILEKNSESEGSK
jgi:tetratricopeptide (TPR) repeat protein